MRRPRYLFVDLTDKLFQRAERCRIHIVPRHLINGIGHNNLPTPLQSKPHKIAAQLIFLDKGQARHANQTVQSSEIRVEKHEGDFDPAGPVARIHDVVEDTAEVPLDVFALDVQVVRQDELVLAEPALAICKRAREIEVGEVLALDVLPQRPASGI